MQKNRKDRVCVCVCVCVCVVRGMGATGPSVCVYVDGEGDGSNRTKRPAPGHRVPLICQSQLGQRGKPISTQGPLGMQIGTMVAAGASQPLTSCPAHHYISS